uniref:triose-phosphate isomerase n=1 Tax=Tetraselmis sp. GSL018 TaxID=582737 RepID=A0A061QMK6_9CHLO|eukprot:CAMPEP_0177599852 /NCGR_PEP_ID=MMETSP0419_2-20121207/13251_1 /TAXON_ID=582737 /ORGANISM="Tetraselmis sp., Strain GSL018" /LENGTH=259 /DNA_ID=CAMNT_0019092687 /DNA_START=158 /DNA_END=937 /DNA_ORIENTATION=+
MVPVVCTRRPIVGGNWKCNGTLKSISALLDVYNSAKIEGADHIDVVIAPASLHISHVIGKLRSDWSVAAQNCWTGQGAYTGEKSADQIADIGCQWVILGHSERRQIMGEECELIAKKAKVALDDGLSVMVCIGETEEERDAGRTLDVIHEQLTPVAEYIKDWSRVVIAYEPIWAIGTGKVATPEMAQEAHADIRNWIQEHVSHEVAETVRIMYGGSVNAGNCEGLLAGQDIDGFLVGGASLKPDFCDIVETVSKLRLAP